MPSDLPDHYAALAVSPTAPIATIRASYRRIMREVHPDVAGDDARAAATAQRVTAAWSVLKDPVRRAEYDRRRAAAAAGPAPNGSGRPRATEGTPSWGPGGIRPVTAEQLREAAARESAYSAISRTQRDAFSLASRRWGLAILGIGAVLLTVFAGR